MNRKKFTLALLVLVFLLLVGACQPAAAPETSAPDPAPTQTEQPEPTASPPAPAENSSHRILFIGDSFTEGLNEFFEVFAASGDPHITVESQEIVQGGMSLWGHWLSPNTLSTIQQGDWSVVVLQEDFNKEESPADKFYEYTRNFDAEIKKAGAETILYMHWEYDNGNTTQIEEIADIFTDIGTELGVKVAPVGLAWDRSFSERPDLDPYGGDREHTSSIGNALTIFVLYATIFGESPEGIPGPPEISAEDLAYLQRIAWETVVEYQEENNQ